MADTGRTGLPVALNSSAMYLAIAIAGALRRRGRRVRTLADSHRRSTGCRHRGRSLRNNDSEKGVILDVNARDPGRLEEVIDAIGRFGPVSTSPVLREYPAHRITPAL